MSATGTLLLGWSDVCIIFYRVSTVESPLYPMCSDPRPGHSYCAHPPATCRIPDSCRLIRFFFRVDQLEVGSTETHQIMIRKLGFLKLKFSESLALNMQVEPAMCHPNHLTTTFKP